jgi:thiol-disulfide isomerase/thioredoxin
MYNKLTTLLKVRGVKLTLEILFIAVLFFAVKAYMQRNLIDGPAPLLEGDLLSGQSISLHSFKDQPVLLHFWATWCPVCKLEQDSIEAISKDHKVITIAMNSGNDLEVQAFLEENQLSFPVIVDENGGIAERFGVSGVPTSFIIDNSGQIAFTEVGYTTSWGLRLRLWMAQ